MLGKLFHVERLLSMRCGFSLGCRVKGMGRAGSGADNSGVSYSDPNSFPDPPSESGIFLPSAPSSANLNSQALEYLDQIEAQVAGLSELLLEPADGDPFEQDQASTWFSEAGLGLAAVLAHEINNMMTPLGIYTARARRHRDSPELVHQALESAVLTIERVSRLTETILDLARRSPEESDGDDETRACRPREVAERVADDLRAAHPDSGIRIETDDVDERLVAPIDANALERVLSNIVNNAHRAIRRSDRGNEQRGKQGSERGGEIRLSGGVDRSCVWLAVTDDGPGLDPGLASTLFEPWHQHSGGGHGLGLSLCHELVSRAGGTLTCEPAEPHGCRFVIRF